MLFKSKETSHEYTVQNICLCVLNILVPTMKHLLSEQVKNKLFQPLLDAINTSHLTQSETEKRNNSPRNRWTDGCQQIEKRCQFFL